MFRGAEAFRPSHRPMNWGGVVAGATSSRLAPLCEIKPGAAEGERAALLEAERARLAALADDPVAQLMAADIARQIEGPNPTWHEVMRRGIEGE